MLVLKDFLEIENNPEIYNYKFEFDNILMWPFIRYRLYGMMFDKYYKHISLKINKKKRRNYINNIPYVASTIINNPYKNILKKYDILMFCSGITNIKKDNKYFNRVSDYFAFMNEDKTLLIEDSNKKEYYRSRHFPNVCFHDFIELIAYAASRFSKAKIKDINKIKNFIKFIDKKCSYGLEISELEKINDSLLNLSKKLNIYYCMYKKIFDMYKPKVIFLEDSSYGIRSYILKWAKDRNIITAELQHGAVSGQHPAYNYGDLIVNSRCYDKYLPDYFLSYGKYWNDLINLPVKKVPIGNPYYSENKKKLGLYKKNKIAKKKILIISQWTMTGVLLKIAQDLSSLLDLSSFDILFRPHPAEIAMFKKKYNNIFITDSIKIDYNSNVYLSLSNADYVVGAYSTVLFEAIGICKSIFAINHPFTDLVIPKDIKRFSNSKELVYLIQNDNQKENKIINSNYIWKPNWENNYKNFINGLLNL